nr:RNA-directed DNA polymerase [Tanacetum cinerariifolium]
MRSFQFKIELGGSLSYQTLAAPSGEYGNIISLITSFGTSLNFKVEEKTRSKQAWETLNRENPILYVYDCGNHRGGIQKETLCRLGLQVEITECIGKVSSNYPGSLCSLRMRVSSPECVNKAPYCPGYMESCLVYDTDNEEDAEPAPKYDSDRDELVYEDEEGKVCNMIIDEGSCENVVSTYMVEKLALKTVDHPKSYQLTWLKKVNVVEVSKRHFLHFSSGKKYQEGYLKAAPIDDKLGFTTIKVRGRVLTKKGNLMHGIQI